MGERRAPALRYHTQRRGQEAARSKEGAKLRTECITQAVNVEGARRVTVNIERIGFGGRAHGVWRGLVGKVGLREAKGPIVLETIEDVPHELGDRRIRRPAQVSERCVLRLGVAAHIDGSAAVVVALVNGGERPGAGWSKNVPEELVQEGRRATARAASEPVAVV